MKAILFEFLTFVALLFIAVLFEDAVILGIGTDNVSNAFSPAFSSRNSNLFSYYNLERTVSSFWNLLINIVYDYFGFILRSFDLPILLSVYYSKPGEFLLSPLKLNSYGTL